MNPHLNRKKATHPAKRKVAPKKNAEHVDMPYVGKLTLFMIITSFFYVIFMNFMFYPDCNMRGGSCFLMEKEKTTGIEIARR